MALSSTILYTHTGILLLLSSPFPGRLEDEMKDYREKEILEMLHIKRLTAPYRSRPHPYMRRVYQHLNSGSRDLSDSEGTLVQSFRSVQDPKHGVPGWIWFNISFLKPTMTVAELVLFRKTLHPQSVTVEVAVHSVYVSASNVTVSEPLDGKVLTLNELPASGYDVFNVSAILGQSANKMVGFQLRYTDESGSLVLHEALTQSLYCLNTSSQNEPLMVAYQFDLKNPNEMPSKTGRQRRQLYRAARMVRLPEELIGKQIPSPECRLFHHYVNLRSLRLDHWILEPPGFLSGVCRGQCCRKKCSYETREENDGSKNRTNTESHCIPQRLKSLNVMYASEEEDVTIEMFKGIRAESCICK
ncbi:bone morphogenetic protein 2-B [Polypterus senegalus]|uniref:bone morphogenetic protein 2-B n=1 Tax=Polypterus senegalus TaxID=55291 RepID=UPI001963068B|nr:bone morphogenetic protein 2-B [Polypterus senegalus]